MGQTMQDLKKKGESKGQEESEKIKGEAQEKGTDVAKEKGEQAKKKIGI